MTTIGKSYDETHPFNGNIIGYTLRIPTITTNSNSEKTTTKNIKKPLLILCHPFNNSRHYFLPQTLDPQLSSYPLLLLDALGFAQSTTYGAPWTFDEYTTAIFEILDKLDSETESGNEGRRLEEGFECILIGDSMGGGPTGLRVGLENARRVKEGKRGLIRGVVAVGTSSERESDDFVTEYTTAALQFSLESQNPSLGPLTAIKNLSTNMSNDGYTTSLLPPFPAARLFGQKVIEDSLVLTLISGKGMELEGHGKEAGEGMIENFRCLNFRDGLVEELSERPSLLGSCQVLVIHGTLDKAYPMERGYHTRTMEAIGDKNSELYIVEGGPHFVTVTHFEEVDRVILDWIGRKCSN